MVACVFKIKVYKSTVALKKRRTVHSEWYTDICLPEVIREIWKKQKQSRINLHHDNARAHTSAQIKELVASQKIEFMGHLPYSPNFAPNDFIPLLKN